MLAELGELEGLASSSAAEMGGALRILGPSSFGQMHLVPIVCGFLEEHPRVSIELSLSDEYVDLVSEGFDMAIRIGELRDSSLAARRLGNIRRVAFASPVYLKRFGIPREPKDLAQHRGIVYSAADEKQFWRFVNTETKKHESVEVRSLFRVNTGDAMRAAALAGYGASVLPTFCIHKEVAAGQLVPLMLPYEKVPTSIHAVYPSRRLIPTRVRTFVDYLAARWGANPYWDRDVVGPEAMDSASGAASS